MVQKHSLNRKMFVFTVSLVKFGYINVNSHFELVQHDFYVKFDLQKDILGIFLVDV